MAMLLAGTGAPALASAAAATRKTASPRTPSGKAPQTGTASWHAPCRSECRTASNRLWKNNELVAAHRTLPLGSKIRVVNVRNNRNVIVEITDRGPYSHGRIIDVSLAAANQLGMVSAGTAQVRLEPVVDGQVAEETAPTADTLAAMMVAALQGWGYRLPGV